MIDKKRLPDSGQIMADERKKRGRWQRVVSAAAAVVVFCSVYALILPAITEESDLICGRKEHRHTDECYSEIDDLVCLFPEHEHTDECYKEEIILTCTELEREGHIHDENCYKEAEELICSLDESEEHHHTEDCYERRLELVCSIEEGEGHVHGEECYELTKVLSCEMEEHRHDGNCFEKTRTLVCGLEEHVHSDVCYGKPGGDPEADIESEDDWIDSISEIKAGASPAENLISVADTQLGYTESDKNFVVTESGEKKGYTRYGAWRGEPYDDWNCSFASFCVYYAGGRDLPIGSVCAEWLEAMNGYEKVDTIDPKGLVPESGDIVFLDTDGDLSVDRADRKSVV